MRLKSIRARLLLWQILAVVLVAAAVSALTYQLAWDGFNRVRDYGLEQIAYSVLRHDVTPIPKPSRARAGAAAKGTASDSAVLPYETTSPAEAARASKNATVTDAADATDPATEDDDGPDLGQFVSQVWSPDGELLYSSLEDDGPPLQQPGFHLVVWSGEAWRVYTLPRGTRTVQVAVTSAHRAEGFAELAPWLVLPLTAIVLLLALLIQAAVSHALRPLRQLQRDIGSRAVNQLQPLPLEGLPTELAPLVQALNDLLARVDALIDTQRRFLADAAHELNTPLSAIKLQAQLALRAPAGQREQAWAELEAGIERTIHLVSQLLQMARLEPKAAKPVREPLRLDALVAQVVAAMSARAEQHGIDLGVTRKDPVTVLGDAAAWRVLLENLIDNAVRYCPRGTQVDVALALEAEQTSLAVADRGPGIDAADRDRVLERFVRLQSADVTGSGLGLAIVREIAQQHGAHVGLSETPGGGLTVTVSWPTDTTATASPTPNSAP